MESDYIERQLDHKLEKNTKKKNNEESKLKIREKNSEQLNLIMELHLR